MKNLIKRIIVWALGYEPASSHPSIGDRRVINNIEHVLISTNFDGLVLKETWAHRQEYISKMEQGGHL